MTNFGPSRRSNVIVPGDVVYLHLVGQGLVFLNSPEAAFDLLDKRGSIYSDKPSLVMTGELCVFFFVDSPRTPSFSFLMLFLSQMWLQKYGASSLLPVTPSLIADWVF